MKTALRLTVLAVLCSLIVFGITASAANPKTTGDADWANPYSGQANTTFNAIATTATGLGAKGSLIYTDPNVTYSMDVQFVKVVGNTAWFVGQVTSVTPAGGYNGCCQVGNWVFYEVQDNYEPGVNVHIIWGEDLTQGENIRDSATAMAKVQTQATPQGGPFTINGGNIQVH